MMRHTRRIGRWMVVLGVLLLAPSPSVVAQSGLGIPAGASPARPFPGPYGVRPPMDHLQRVQAVPGDQPLLSTENLALPAAERGFGAGGPTEGAAAAEAEEEEVSPEEDQRWLQGVLGLEDSPVLIYGWIQNGFTANANGNGTTRTNFGVNPNNQANKWMGNQYYLVIEDPLEQDDTINLGFRVDNLFGNDWSFNYMQGLLNDTFRPVGSFAGYDLAQVYGEIHLPDPTGATLGMDIKGGRFYTLAGYEVVPAIGRPLYSVPYMFTYGQPFTHFGVMTTWHINDRLNLYNGAINGWDRWINERYQWGYMGGFAWNSEDEKTAFAFTACWGPNQYPSFLPANQQLYTTGYINIPSLARVDNPQYHSATRTLFTSVLTHEWSDKLTQVIETDQGWELNVPGLASPIVDGEVISGAAKSAQWQSFGNWFLYNFSDKLTGVWRSEVFWDQQGNRTGLNDGTRFVGDRFYEMTLGLIYKPIPHLWVRPEARYDWSQFHDAYTDNTRKSQFTYGFDVILLY